MPSAISQPAGRLTRRRCARSATGLGRAGGGPVDGAGPERCTLLGSMADTIEDARAASSLQEAHSGYPPGARWPTLRADGAPSDGPLDDVAAFRATHDWPLRPRGRDRLRRHGHRALRA